MELINNKNIIKFFKFEGSLVNMDYIKDLHLKIKFFEIVSKIIDFQYKNSIDFIFGFPSKSALASQIKGRFDYTRMNSPVYNFFISYEFKFKFKFKLLYNLKIIKFLDFLNKFFLISFRSSSFKFEEFNQSNLNKLEEFNNIVYKKYKGSYTIHKNYNYIKWKYIENKTGDYKIYSIIKKNKILGIVGIKIEVNKLHIVDIEYLNIIFK